MHSLKATIVATCACAVAGLAFAQASDPVFGSVACAYNVLPPKVRAGINPNSPESKARRPGDTPPLKMALDQCAAKSRWDKAHTELSARYAVARVDFEQAEAKLIAAGGKAGAVKAAWEGLGEGDRAIALQKGVQAPEVLGKAYDELGKQGAQSEDGLVALAHFINTQRFENEWMAAKDNKPATKAPPPVQGGRRRG